MFAEELGFLLDDQHAAAAVDWAAVAEHLVDIAGVPQHFLADVVTIERLAVFVAGDDFVAGECGLRPEGTYTHHRPRAQNRGHAFWSNNSGHIIKHQFMINWRPSAVG